MFFYPLGDPIRLLILYAFAQNIDSLLILTFVHDFTEHPLFQLLSVGFLLVFPGESRKSTFSSQDHYSCSNLATVKALKPRSEFRKACRIFLLRIHALDLSRSAPVRLPVRCRKSFLLVPVLEY